MNWLIRCGIRGYNATLAHLIGGQCRFYPSCSEYCRQAIEKYAQGAFEHHSFWRALRLTTLRIAKCHPWHPGGIDLVPRKNHER